MRYYSIAAFAALSLLACGGNDDKKDNTDEPTTGVDVSLSQSDISIAAGASASITVDLIRGSAVQGEEVTLSVSAGPSGVTATLDSTTTTADTATLSIAVALSAAPATSTLTITVSDATSVGTATLHLTTTAPAAFDINGTVLNTVGTQRPTSAVKLWSGDKSAPKTTTTADDGTFTIAHVVPPYDVLFQRDNVSVLVLGASSATPVFSLYFDLAPAGPSKSIVTPTLSGGSADAGTMTTTALSCAHGWNANEGTTVEADFAADDTLSEPCSLRVLQAHQTSGTLDGYSGYAETVVEVTPGSPATPTMNLGSALPTRPITYAYHGGDSGLVTAFWIPGDRSGFGVGQFPLAASGTIIVPVDSRIPIAAAFSATDSTGFLFKQLPASVTHIEVDALLPAALLTAPTGTPTDVNDSTIFTLASAAGDVNVFGFQNSASSDSVYVMTADASITPAVLTAHDLPLASGATYTLQPLVAGPGAIDSDVSLTHVGRIEGGHFVAGTTLAFGTE